MFNLSKFSKRYLNLQEYHSKKLLKQYGCNIQKFYNATSPRQAKDMANRLRDVAKTEEFVIKAQILAGGRGRGTFSNGFVGGVQLTKDPDTVYKLAENMLGERLVTKQTSKDGSLVSTIMVAHALNIKQELYLAIVMDRDHNGPVIVSSPRGGVNIETVANENPELIYKTPINIFDGIDLETALKIVKNLQVDESLHQEMASEIMQLYKLFISVDATQVEINPLGITDTNSVVCFDAKINFDDCASFRQKDIFKLNDTSEMDPRDVIAEKNGLNFIPLTGNIACIVNGAGLAMATMDLVKFHGGEPANFLDLGGGVTIEGVISAFEIICQKKESIDTILVNIFGGIVNCEVIAKGIIKAIQTLDIKIPIVVRLEGTNVENARKILKKSNLKVINADGFDDVAKKAIYSSQQVQQAAKQEEVEWQEPEKLKAAI